MTRRVKAQASARDRRSRREGVLSAGQAARMRPLADIRERFCEMPSLPEVLTSDAKKAAVVDDCCALIDAEVKDKGGISGLAIKAGYGAVKGIKPGFVKQVVTDLLPDFAKALDPIFQDAVEEKKAIATYFTANTSRVAEALPAITDAEAA